MYNLYTEICKRIDLLASVAPDSEEDMEVEEHVYKFITRNLLQVPVHAMRESENSRKPEFMLIRYLFHLIST